jgi:hypothetical protein
MLFSFGHRRRIGPFGQYFILIPVWSIVICIFAIYVCWHQKDHLATDAVTAEATIVALHPELHDTVTYAFTVSGHTYQARASRNDQAFSNGMSVRAYYDPNNPWTSSIEDPALVKGRELRVICVVLLFAISITIFVCIKPYVSQSGR